MRAFSGTALFLDRNDINTDEIIPARYLTENSKRALEPYLLEDLILDGFDPAADISGKGVVVARANFGCGSSREHAPWALEANGIYLVIAESFARIFRQNMFNCGMMAVSLPGETVDLIFRRFSEGPTEIRTDLGAGLFVISSGETEERIPFTISEFDRALVEAGGWLEYADGKY
jgi:3-isopropylmalate/(R)-2-methylmalate dehydratase small subunit